MGRRFKLGIVRCEIGIFPRRYLLYTSPEQTNPCLCYSSLIAHLQAIFLTTKPIMIYVACSTLNHFSLLAL